MMDDVMNPEETKPSRFSRRIRVALAAAALIAVGGAAGAAAISVTQPSVEMAPLAPTPIRSLTEGDSIVTVKGQAAEVFGNKFIMADASGRALVDTGRAGENKALVAVGQSVTVQGRFEHGFVHASFLVSADGKVMSLRPMGPPHGHRGPPEGRDHHPGDGPRDAGPPPEAQVPAAAATPATPAQ